MRVHTYLIEQTQYCHSINAELVNMHTFSLAIVACDLAQDKTKDDGTSERAGARKSHRDNDDRVAEFA